MFNRKIFLALALSLAPSLASAHHGQDFLLLESPGIPHPGDIYLVSNAQLALEKNAEEQAGFEPALLFGLTRRVAFELHAHTEKLAGYSWTYEATAPAIHILLTDPNKHSGLKVGIGLEYEIAAEDDAPDNAEFRLSIENTKDKNKLDGNLILDREHGGETDVAAALGFRHKITDAWSLGLEAQSSVERAAGAKLLFGGYYDHEQNWVIKLGLGGQREEDGHITPVLHIGWVLLLKG
ncbi:MAG: hypothetical protein ABI644_09300 [Arenimonas sp.]